MSRNKSIEPTLNSLLTKENIESSDTFCMIPWIHLHTNPSGRAAPCCIAKSSHSITGVGNANTQRLIEIINSDKMNALRLDMLHNKKNEECFNCYAHESQGINSFRKTVNSEFNSYIDDVLHGTNADGSLKYFKMRYFDIRFNNICNFKCRTCCSEFSSQWEQEDIKHIPNAAIMVKNNNKDFLNDIIDQIDNIQMAYFAGGEPLITEEHYLLLEEMIRRNKTNIHLRYNTNLSNLKFKNKDLLSLWKHFTNRIDIYASIDHYGSRAEYIRHGTVWSTVEENFFSIKKLPYVNIQTNTVLSVFNCLTFYDFWKYMIDTEMYTPNDPIFSIYNMDQPSYLACHILPEPYKQKAKNNIKNAIQMMQDKGFSKDHIMQLENTLPWLFAGNTWELEKEKFKAETNRLDIIRAENFSKTFPELSELLYE